MESIKHKKSVAYEVPDGGYGWVVTIAYGISIGLQQLTSIFGIIFSPPFIEMGASSKTIAFVYAIYFTIWNLTGPFVGPVAQEFGWRNVGIFAGLLTSISFIISAFATSPLYLALSYSVLSGIAGSCTGNMAFPLIASYFRQNLGLANAVLLSGVGVGAFVGPLYINFFLEQYSFKGAAIVYGALVLNGCAMSLLYHPVEQHMKMIETDSEEKKPLTVHPDVEEIKRKIKLNAKLDSQIPRNFSARSISEYKDMNRFLTHRRSSLYASTLDIGGIVLVSSSAALSSLNISENHEKLEKLETEKELPNLDNLKPNSDNILRTLLNIFKRTMGCVTILKSLQAVIIVLGGVFIQNVRVSFPMMVPFALQSDGHTLETAAWCLSLAAIADAVMKIFISALSDRSWFNKRKCFMGGTLLIALSILAFSLVSSLFWLKILMFTYGIGVGTVMALNNLLMVELCGHDNLYRIIGATCLANGAGAFVIGPISGWIRDITNSYSISLQFFATISMFCFLLWCLMPLAKKIDQRKQIDNRGEA